MLKRAFDLAAALGGLAVLAPAFAAVAAAIKATSPGPVFFRQTRVGKGGREFRIFKFRTMRPDAPRTGPTLTVGADPRITGIGRVLRRYKIDELPQLLNVLLGDMSFVGPRPEVPRYVAGYTAEQRRVLSVRPGITDYASIAYKNENAVLAAAADPERAYVEEVLPHKLRLGLRYIDRRCFLEDLRIVLATLWLTVRPGGAEQA